MSARRHHSAPAGPEGRSVFAALPWPSAEIGPHGEILAVNPAFSAHFPLARPGVSTLDDLFEPGADGEAPSVSLIALSDENGSWQGIRKAKPGASDTKYRLMLNHDAANPGVRWLFLPDNPSVNGRAQLTPRSEIELTRMVLDHTPDFLFLRDPHGGIIFASRALTRFLRTPGEGYENGRPITNFLSRECAATFDRIDRDTLEHRRTVNLSRFSFETPAGARVVLDLTQEPIYNAAGNLVGMLTFGRDITARIARENRLHIALEEARAAGEAKAFFVANVSHEIRTPLNGILGMTELCLDTPLSAEQSKYLRTVLDCGRTLLTLVNDILDFSKVEASRVTFETIEFDLVRLVADTAAHFAPRAHEKRVELVLDTDPELPLRVKGDPTRIRQIVANLLGNAVKFTERGHVAVALRVIAKDGDSLRVRVDVADTGIGIAPEKQTAIFEAFTQEDATTTRRFGGTGLGLAICKRLTDMMGGSLTVQSKPGVGSVFSAEFPLMIAAPEEIGQGSPMTGSHVEIRGDDPVQREALSRLFRSLGARVTESDPKHPPLPGLDAEPVDLLVADYPVAQRHDHPKTDEAVLRRAGEGVPVLTLGGLRHEPAVLSRLRSLPHRHLMKPAGAHDLRAASLALIGVEDDADTSLAEGDRRRARRLHVLLAEDNPVNRELAIRRLEKLGHRVEIAEDGGVARHKLATRRYDIVFLDVQMPVLDGLSLARLIREQESSRGAGRLPLVALTALAMASDRRECLDAGFDALLTKPFLIGDLRRTIDRLLPDVDDADHGHAADADERSRDDRPGEFDFDAVLRGLDPAEAEDLRFAGDVFLDYHGKELAALDEAVAAKNAHALALIAHRVKGGVASLRAKEAVEISATLEAVAKTGDFAACEPLVPRLRGTIADVARGIRASRPGETHP